jgi:hypothetical protein
MKAISKTSLLLAVALASVCVIAASAQAVTTITPAGTAVSGAASATSWTYGGTLLVCDTSTVTGTTRNPPTGNLSLTISFQGSCLLSAFLKATITCSGNITMIATGAATSVIFDLDTGFTCTASVSGVCNIDIEGPQFPGNFGTLNEAATTLTATVSFNATRTGSSSCGPASGPGSFTASYNVTPNTLTIT